MSACSWKPKKTWGLLISIVLCSVLLAGCDPCATKTVCIRLTPQKSSHEIVLRALTSALLEAGFRNLAGDAGGEGTFQADIVEGDRHTTALVYVSYRAEKNEIALNVRQYFGSSLSPKTKALLAIAKERIVKTGRVEEILVGRRVVYRP